MLANWPFIMNPEEFASYWQEAELIPVYERIIKRAKISNDGLQDRVHSGYQNSTAKYTLFHVQLNSNGEIP